MDIVTASTSSMVNHGSFFRFVAVFTIFLFNLIALFRLAFCHHLPYCVHSIVYGSTTIFVIFFLSPWIPYLFSSYYHSTAWPIIGLNTHCTVQHLINIEVSTFLLVGLVFLKMFEAFANKRAKVLCLTILFAWIIPQSIYTIIMEVFTIKGSSQYFMFDNYSSSNETMFSTNNNQQGVLLCVYGVNVSTDMINKMIWHYVALVTPLTFIFIICVGANAFSRLPFVCDTCDCSTDVILSLSLYSNFVWLLFLRPVLTSISLIRSNDAAKLSNSISSGSLILELGFNLILFIIALCLPFSTKFGLFSSNTSIKKKSKIRTKSMNVIC